MATEHTGGHRQLALLQTAARSIDHHIKGLAVNDFVLQIKGQTLNPFCQRQCRMALDQLDCLVVCAVGHINVPWLFTKQGAKNAGSRAASAN